MVEALLPILFSARIVTFAVADATLDVPLARIARVSAEPAIEDVGIGPGLVFCMDDELATAFERLTGEHIGHRMRIVFDGRTALEATVRVPIENGCAVVRDDEAGAALFRTLRAHDAFVGE